MSRLVNAIRASYGDYAVLDAHQCPAGVALCQVPAERFAEAAGIMKENYALLAAEWASDETPFGEGYGVYACYRWGREYLMVKAAAPAESPSFQSLTAHYVAAYRFERQIHSLFGIVPVGHADLRPWIRFEDWPEGAWPLRKGFDGSAPLKREYGEYAWAQARGEGVYEIPVGPVHAGIIEPGHFRFQAVGEQVINLEERLGYVHKGIEKKFESMGWTDASRLAGRVSGDTTVAHALSYCMALESMSGCVAPSRAQWLRALLLERERVANHLGDIGAICNDVAFAFMLHQCMRLKERMLGNNLAIFGHRLLMDRVVPGGVSVDIDQAGRDMILSELDDTARDFERLVRIYDENSSLEDRVRNTGVLTPEKARELCVVGIVARASGLNLDCRIFNAFPPYDQYHRLQLDVPLLISGDVHARAWVRVHEVRESIRIMRWLFTNMPGGGIMAECAMPAPATCGFASVEGWRGEIVYWLQAGPEGGINRVMVRDPSSVNWIGLEQAMPGNIVPDFPLCNKSFNQSYSGNDL